MTLWSGRAEGELDPAVWEFLRADDLELLPYDCTATAEHAARLHGAGLLTSDELNEVEERLSAIAHEPEAVLRSDEDVHSAIERLLGPVGKKIHAYWSAAHENLPALVQSQQPKVGDLARKALGFVASIGGGILGFLASFLIAGVIMAFGREGAGASQAIFARIISPERAPVFVKLSTATIRAVAQGVIGVALIQAIAVGVTLLVAKVPLAGVASLIVLVLGIAQIPALLVTLPAIAYLWTSGDYGTGAAVTYSIVLFIAGIADNFLKPLMLGRGVDAPMPVILLGALGGMATAGILGLFVGAVLLALGYQIFMNWVHGGAVAPEAPPVAQ